MKIYEPGDSAWYFGDGTGADLRIVVVVGLQNEDDPERLFVLDGHQIGLDCSISELQTMQVGQIWMCGKNFRYCDKGKFDSELSIQPGAVVRHKTDSLLALGVVDKSSPKIIQGQSSVCVHWGHKDSFVRSVDVRDLR